MNELPPLPKLGPAPRMRNYLLDFYDPGVGQKWFTVYASGTDEAFEMGEVIEKTTGYTFRWEATEL